MTSFTDTSPALRTLSRWLACCSLQACLAMAVSPFARAEPAEPPPTVVAQSRLGTGAIVEGIIGYTSWPRTSRDLMVCVTDAGVHASDIKHQLYGSHATRPLTVKPIEADQSPPTDCDVIFFDGWSRESQNAALRSVAQKPVLTIGRGADFCSDGGIFCLSPDSAGTRFEVNLDALSRSGLHVHPQVLRLAHPRGGRTS